MDRRIDSAFYRLIPVHRGSFYNEYDIDLDRMNLIGVLLEDE